jgi:hypothetical protein
MALPDARPGQMGRCAECRQKFRVPSKAPGPRRDPSPDDEDDDEDLPMAVSTEDEEPTPAPRRKRAALADDDDEARSRDRDAEARSRPVTPRKPSAEEEDLSAIMRRPKKKKKKEKQSGGLSGTHIALIGVGLFLVVLATGGFFLIQHGAFGKAKPPDPEVVLAELAKFQASVERDANQAVVGVSFQYCDFTPELLRKLAAFPELRRLNLGATKASGATLESIEDLTSLQVLNLANTKVTSGGMKYLKRLTNLEDLNVAQTLVDDDGLAELKDLKNLKKLNVVGSRASGAVLQAAIPGLQVMR